MKEFNSVVIIPTGIGCEIGGHNGDANPVIRLIGSVCDNIITHPNAVNASDINEMPENCWYVEGSTLDKFLDGNINLEKKGVNKIVLLVNSPKPEIINSASAARVTLGANIEVAILRKHLIMEGFIESNKAVGHIHGCEELIQQVRNYEYDIIAIATPILVKREVKFNYFKNGGINPWGGVEALLSKTLSQRLGIMVVHAPNDETTYESDEELFLLNEVVDPRIAPEMVSVSYLHSVLKGCHYAPKITDRGLSYKNIDVLITPDNCYSTVHKICENKNIPIIVVKENKTLGGSPFPSNYIFVENYSDLMGMLCCMKERIYYESIRRPINKTKIL